MIIHRTFRVGQDRLVKFLDEIRKEMLIKALRYGKSYTATAKMLGISERHFRTYRTKYKLEKGGCNARYQR